MKLSLGTVGIGYQRAPPKLFDGHLGLCDLFLDTAKLAMLEKDLNVELLRDSSPDELQALRGVLKLKSARKLSRTGDS